jgi:hypothetical protein
LDPQQLRLYLETKTINLNAKQIALVRPVLERRTRTFIAALESEFLARSVAGLKDNTKRMGVSVFAWDEE